MDIVRIKSTEDKYFARVWEIYCCSFPEHEKRTLEQQQRIMDNSHFIMEAYLENGEVIGLNGYWDFGQYLYIEHFAMAREARSGGRGSLAMREFLGRSTVPVVLEIDPVVDEISERRLEFYQRLGYVVNPHKHQQNPYRNGDEAFDLVVLTYPAEVSAEVYRDFKDNQDNIVLRRFV